MAMLISAEVSRKHLEVKNPELLLAPRSSEQRIKPILVVSGSICGNDGVCAE
ncbi:hypothetical protein [Erythrobacter sp. SD-21]|uniref:hypothetical protein n=1 Tax=Erythrobacter sp. SD-21 TaxID=161528 RepID=UPI000153EFD0|nr:hypothetical protein [Erythrobacter sp. SD-21]EDL47994.1 hypothetical protein ED21_25647 [Erythrobacter sp. SD-21]